MHRRRERGEVHAVTATRTQGAHMALAIEPDRDGRAGCASLLGRAVGYEVPIDSRERDVDWQAGGREGHRLIKRLIELKLESCGRGGRTSSAPTAAADAHFGHARVVQGGPYGKCRRVEWAPI